MWKVLRESIAFRSACIFFRENRVGVTEFGTDDTESARENNPELTSTWIHAI